MITVTGKNGKSIQIDKNWRPKRWWALIKKVCLKQNNVCLESEPCDTCPRGIATNTSVTACLEALERKAAE